MSALERDVVVPAELRDRAQWLLWRFESHKGDKKPRKMPYYANSKRRHGAQGSVGDRAQLVSCDAAVEAKGRGKYDGVGFALLPDDGIVAIDLDNVIDKETGEISDRAQKIIDACRSYTEYSPSRRGVHIFVLGTVERSFKSNAIGVEVFCGGQFLTFTGEIYPGAPETVNAVDEKVLPRLRATVEEAKGKRGGQARSVPTIAADKRSKVESALAFVSSDCGHDEWLEVLMAIHAELGTDGFDIADHWSSKSPKYPGRAALQTRWNSFNVAGGITGATLYKRAADVGWRPPRRPRAAGAASLPPQQGEQKSEESLPPEYSEDKLALIFTSRYGPISRYVAAWGRWLHDDGKRWGVDETRLHFDRARRVCRDVARELIKSSVKNAERTAALIKSARTVAAVVNFASADRVHASGVADWDCDPWLLNTPGGIVDLRTGRLGPYRRDAYCTKMTAVAPGGKCPLWGAFLMRITGRNRHLVAYLQLLAGYALTGVTREHSLAFFYGVGANGKSTCLNTLAGAMGDYAQVAAMETFIESHVERHPTDLAALRGARLVIGSETEEGQRWAASRIKTLTGGDPITARFMRQDFFTYVPQFKLILAGNHRPTLRNVDEAMRRRLHLVPFTQLIPPAERDQKLPERLRAEWPGILAWAIRGCLRWQRLGLRQPDVVRDATDLYLQDEDVLVTWLMECVEIDAKSFSSTTQLHSSYQAWAERSREKFYGVKRFGQLLEERGYARERTARASGFRGMRIIEQPATGDLLK